MSSEKEFIDIEVDISNEIGDERIAKINLSRSLIEMDQQEEAKRLLNEILQNTPSENEKRIMFWLLDKIDK